MDEIFGLPAHPLVVHAAVVLVPLAAVGVVVTAFWPEARRRLAWVVLGIAAVGLVTSFLAGESGESLEERVKETDAVEEHAELGESGTFAAAAVFVGAAAVAGVEWSRRRRPEDPPWGPRAAVATGVVAVVLSGVGTFQIARIGHSGAEATWGDTPTAREGGDEAPAEDREEGEDEDEDEDEGASASPVPRRASFS
jgi:uncharacterized membrane protein